VATGDSQAAQNGQPLGSRGAEGLSGIFGTSNTLDVHRQSIGLSVVIYWAIWVT